MQTMLTVVTQNSRLPRRSALSGDRMAFGFGYPHCWVPDARCPGLICAPAPCPRIVPEPERCPRLRAYSVVASSKSRQEQAGGQAAATSAARAAILPTLCSVDYRHQHIDMVTSGRPVIKPK